MTAFDPPAPIVTSLVNAALAEDLGLLGDITSNACVDDDRHGVASFVTRDAGVLAGTALATEVYRQADPEVVVSWLFTDGDTVEAGAELGRVTGRLRSILAGERVALKFHVPGGGPWSLHFRTDKQGFLGDRPVSVRAPVVRFDG